MSATTAAPASSTPSLASLRNVQVGLREDLEVSRHVFRGRPCYIVRDPMTFQGQRIDASDYEALAAIQSDRTLGASFDDLVKRGSLTASDEQKFYGFVFSLHRIGLLQLPISDERLLYKRFKMREQAKTREKLLGFMMLRLPLWNPSRFLDRTVQWVRPVFTKTFLALWLLLILSAGFMAFSRWEELAHPLDGVLVARNLPLMWLTLVLLKVFHEFGHAYACRHYGGHVPEMGIYLILFTPCAYVDATASWGFSRKRERLIVCFAGMFVESVFAAIAVFVWAATDPSLIHSLAFNVIFLAGLVTVLFNMNPLMRYDGYYILSDWLEIPNLRQRANQYALGVLKRVLLGLPSGAPAGDRRMAVILFTFAVAATLYRITLLTAIAVILAGKMLFLGLLVGISYALMALAGVVRRLTRYLWHSEETAPKRWRAVALGVLFLMVLPALIMWAPVPTSVYAPALLAREQETFVRARTPGFLTSIVVEPNHAVTIGTILAVLEHDAPLELIADAQAGVEAAELRRDAYRIDAPARALEQEAIARVHEAALRDGFARRDQLNVVAGVDGEVLQCVTDRDLGRFFPEGTPVAVIGGGPWLIKAILSEEQYARSAPRVGETVSFRSMATPSQELTGTLMKVSPTGSRTVLLASLTQMGGGEVAVDPATGDANRPYFELTVEVSAKDAPRLRHGLRGVLQLPASAEPLGRIALRRAVRVYHQLLQR